jgi:hypothetical protein
MDKRVHVGEGEAAVHPQDRPAGGAQPASGQFDGFWVGRGERRSFRVGWLTAYSARPPWPEGVAEAVEAVEELDAPGTEYRQRSVDFGQFEPKVVAVCVEPDALLPRYTLDPAEWLALTEALPVAVGARSGGVGWVGWVHQCLRSYVCPMWAVQGGRPSGEWLQIAGGV